MFLSWFIHDFGVFLVLPHSVIVTEWCYCFTNLFLWYREHLSLDFNTRPANSWQLSVMLLSLPTTSKGWTMSANWHFLKSTVPWGVTQLSSRGSHLGDIHRQGILSFQQLSKLPILRGRSSKLSSWDWLGRMTKSLYCTLNSKHVSFCLENFTRKIP